MREREGDRKMKPSGTKTDCDVFEFLPERQRNCKGNLKKGVEFDGGK